MIMYTSKTLTETFNTTFLFFKIKAIGQTELNASNPEEVLQLAAQRRKKKFLQAMAKLYF